MKTINGIEWLLFWFGMFLNTIFGYILGGLSEAGRYTGHYLIYGSLIFFVYYVIKKLYIHYKEHKNFILKS